MGILAAIRRQISTQNRSAPFTSTATTASTAMRSKTLLKPTNKQSIFGRWLSVLSKKQPKNIRSTNSVKYSKQAAPTTPINSNYDDAWTISTALDTTSAAQILSTSLAAAQASKKTVSPQSLTKSAIKTDFTDSTEEVGKRFFKQGSDGIFCGLCALAHFYQTRSLSQFQNQFAEFALKNSDRMHDLDKSNVLNRLLNKIQNTSEIAKKGLDVDEMLAFCKNDLFSVMEKDYAKLGQKKLEEAIKDGAIILNCNNDEQALFDYFEANHQASSPDRQSIINRERTTGHYFSIRSNKDNTYTLSDSLKQAPITYKNLAAVTNAVLAYTKRGYGEQILVLNPKTRSEISSSGNLAKIQVK